MASLPDSRNDDYATQRHWNPSVESVHFLWLRRMNAFLPDKKSIWKVAAVVPIRSSLAESD